MLTPSCSSRFSLSLSSFLSFNLGAPIKIGKPVVSFCEAISAPSSQDCLSKSPNKHNRITMSAQPLNEEFAVAVDKGEINPEDDAKIRARTLSETWPDEWNVGDARSIWCFGCPPDGKANVLVDQTKGVSYLAEIKDSMVGAFGQATLAGCIADETMRAIRFNFLDVTLHADAIHRGAGQIMPPTVLPQSTRPPRLE
jgi:elongation factor 2